MIATDRMQAARIATGGKDAHVVPRVYGRVGYDVPVAQSATFRLKPYDTASDDDDASVVDEANAYAEGSVCRSQAGAGSAVDDPGGSVDDPGGGNTDDLGSFGDLATSTTTSSKSSVSFVSSSLTTGISLLSLSDKSAVDVVGDLDVGDCATGTIRTVWIKNQKLRKTRCFEVRWTTLVHGRLRYWVILLFVRLPAACGGWTLE